MKADELVSGARTILRDFPQYFEVDEGPLNVLTVRLPHPMIDGKTTQVYVSDDALNPPQTTLTTSWQLDERTGLLKLTDERLLNKRVLVTGFYFTWFTDTDLGFHINQVQDEMDYGNTGDPYQPVHYDVIMLGGVVRALWSLAAELSLDIDVSTPEGMFIPARQRYTQIMQMVQYYEGQYNTKTAMLNIGLGSLDQSHLRRVAKLTGRYVPVYIDREFDDPRPPERLYPAIPGVHGEESIVRIALPTTPPPTSSSGGGGTDTVVGVDEVAVQPEEPTEDSVVIWVDSDA